VSFRAIVPSTPTANHGQLASPAGLAVVTAARFAVRRRSRVDICRWLPTRPPRPIRHRGRGRCGCGWASPTRPRAGPSAPLRGRLRRRPLVPAAVSASPRELCWRADERLNHQLLWPEPIDAVIPARIREKTISAGDLSVLVDADLTSWTAWNQFARDFAQASLARIVEIDDGGITGPGFHDRCRKLNAPVLQSLKRHPTPLPAGLRTRPVRDPTPLWCWSLVTRADDDRPATATLRHNAARLTRAAGLHVLPDGPSCVLRPKEATPWARAEANTTPTAIASAKQTAPNHTSAMATPRSCQSPARDALRDGSERRAIPGAGATPAQGPEARRCQWWAGPSTCPPRRNAADGLAMGE